MKSQRPAHHHRLDPFSRHRPICDLACLTLLSCSIPTLLTFDLFLVLLPLHLSLLCDGRHCYPCCFLNGLLFRPPLTLTVTSSTLVSPEIATRFSDWHQVGCLSSLRLLRAFYVRPASPTLHRLSACLIPWISAIFFTTVRPFIHLLILVLIASPFIPRRTRCQLHLPIHLLRRRRLGHSASRPALMMYNISSALPGSRAKPSKTATTTWAFNLRLTPRRSPLTRRPHPKAQRVTTPSCTRDAHPMTHRRDHLPCLPVPNLPTPQPQPPYPAGPVPTSPRVETPRSATS